MAASMLTATVPSLTMVESTTIAALLTIVVLTSNGDGKAKSTIWQRKR